ncbi:MAG: 3-deoxy-7-phosphoheptulonate synthase [Candidatus Eisenbacteria bacterium]|nr:3-deoxy-7-phosphoheptulonate synthase [Candidatus Eisenbacteria bacterium]
MKIRMAPQPPEESIQEVRRRLLSAGYEVHRMDREGETLLCALGPSPFPTAAFAGLPGVTEISPLGKAFKLASREFCPADTTIRSGRVAVGGSEVVLMAGPCAVEGEEQVFRAAEGVSRAGAKVLRGGAFKPRTSPYSFQGLGVEGLRILRQAADRFDLQVVSEIMDISQLDDVSRYVDILQVGARNVQNFTLLNALSRVDKPVLLKRGPATTIDELLLSAEYVMAGGNHRVLLCERGIRTFNTITRNTLDLSAVPVLKELSHLPVIIDPSHAVGIRRMISSMARAAVAAGADGLLIEVHPQPDTALCDGQQSLTLDEFAGLSAELDAIARVLGRAVGGGTPEGPAGPA